MPPPVASGERIQQQEQNGCPAGRRRERRLGRPPSPVGLSRTGLCSQGVQALTCGRGRSGETRTVVPGSRIEPLVGHTVNTPSDSTKHRARREGTVGAGRGQHEESLPRLGMAQKEPEESRQHSEQPLTNCIRPIEKCRLGS